MKVIALTILALVAAVGLTFGTASAFNQADFQKLKTTGNCADCDLSGALLIHWKLAGADLSGADLSGANLTDTWLAGANLSGANLSNAILTGASLAGANLRARDWPVRTSCSQTWRGHVDRWVTVRTRLFRELQEIAGPIRASPAGWRKGRLRFPVIRGGICPTSCPGSDPLLRERR